MGNLLYTYLDVSGGETAMTNLHELKCWRYPFQAIWVGEKTFEFRRNDRTFMSGDWIRLREWDENAKAYTGREITADIGFILNGPSFGMQIGYCVFSLKDICLWPDRVKT
jgi:hypothetical protein